MRGICKAFGANQVLKNVQFSLKGGEVCALLGENGAGKSTLMNTWPLYSRPAPKMAWNSSLRPSPSNPVMPSTSP
ncbi:MAG TPA: ATP-binding cassette domain-containing protein, partial [Anaerolineaceae bacterium]|nr:ATP-binding cassette domain-containing protein [Anaerolineaceae bacterium]